MRKPAAGGDMIKYFSCLRADNSASVIIIFVTGREEVFLPAAYSAFLRKMSGGRRTETVTDRSHFPDF